ncbi:MAG: hypothetical protein K1X74_15640 [Pirellulales bacterium]|nr:hypothetical protein [Pirellulales bacterium]
MSLKQAARTALDAVPSFQNQLHLLTARHDDLQLECELSGLDALGCAFDRFELTADRVAGVGLDRLKQLGQDLSARLTYLLERISPVEIDAQGCTVQLRSNPPQKDDDGTRYYELLVTRTGKFELARYAKAVGNPRQRVAAHVTREVWLRLVDDFAAVATS